VTIFAQLASDEVLDSAYEPPYDPIHHHSFEVSAVNNVIRDVGVFAITAALAFFAFSVQAQALPPCNHPGYSTQTKCEKNTSCKWCGGYCWWNARQCGKRRSGY